MPLHKVHSDLCGPLPVPSMSGCRYWVVFIDDFTRYMFLYPIKARSQLYSCYENFGMKALNIFRSDIHIPEYTGVSNDWDIRALQADNAKEYEKLGRIIFKRYGTHAQFTNAENTYRRTPYELWYNRNPGVEYLKVFGCAAYAHVNDINRDKLDARAKLCMYLGIPEHKKGYRLIDIESHAIVYSRDVVFNETSFPTIGVVDDTTEPLLPPAHRTALTELLHSTTGDDTGSGTDHTPQVEPSDKTTPNPLPSLSDALERGTITYSFVSETPYTPPNRPPNALAMRMKSN
ncbi:unnamed protein product [Phytophthora fragariaefolia]|uniref:Unnamed protein product n=1 Tax=Phytophthora fragariaefolia TaxID=1490495 RepID=A0A9W6X164_9STRA|nr:unnamed protein product [Phytophthora fragariaefolia]